ncbi:hypothetical protein [Psychrobacillus sp. FSL K6-1415]|uniref:hypothetical protein n=1 Tax=Psychrobacillus sp. FSL K6-1415 TaxID=2921544 RepID=UPI0030F55322
MGDHSEKPRGRKFEWIDKWVKMTGERAKIDAKANNTYIIYKTENGTVREYPDGTIVPHDRRLKGEDI